VPALPPAMEDWWLVRDAKGHTGWLLSRLMEVDAPEALTRYAEGQRIVGAYVLAHVNDPESGQLRDGHPDPDIPIYVTVLSAYKAGLPYDFDQVRVFTWNLKKHRYETAFREKNIEGYLPVVVKEATDPYGHAANSAVPLPSFTYRVLAAEAPAPVPDAVTGLVAPGKTIAKTYRLEGNVTRRVLVPGSVAPAEAHPVPEAEKKGKKRKK
ncbi:MAG: SH3 domain-containing protein, partial [Acidobacteriota bacterium]|nr:SH3 domain-containing protein [Acidobacteriota bacterium]